jgi:methionyl-tRNA formyltransferase
MRVLFMGTAGFAEKSLAALYEADRNVCCVITKPDKPRGRGMKIAPDAVKELALKHGTPVYQPDNLSNDKVLLEIKAFAPDIITVVSYGKILPPDILNVPPLGCINIHGSLLPKYRGSAPVQWAVINGEKETGVTSMYMAEGMDTGDIIAIKRTAIGEKETAGELYSRLAGLGAQLLIETLKAIET